jgi:hypothetical protein
MALRGELIQRCATWDREPFQKDGRYAVSAHSTPD